MNKLIDDFFSFSNKNFHKWCTFKGSQSFKQTSFQKTTYQMY